LVKLLDDKLKRLEKRNIEEIKELKYTKIQYNNLNSLLKKISLKTTEENNQKKIFCNDSLYNKSELLKHNGNKNLLKYKLSPKNIQKKLCEIKIYG
jgi:competence transcription factor ComK